jgi:hypothetical protein
MKIVLVGGNARDVGKTSVVVGLISALRDFSWTAVKISPVHAEEPAAASAKVIAEPADFDIREETGSEGRGDTRRYLAAGAQRALWLRFRRPFSAAAARALESAIGTASHVLIESNSALNFLEPSICLMVLDLSRNEFKTSALPVAERADACVLVNHGAFRGHPAELHSSLVQNKPQFHVRRDSYCSDQLVTWLREELGARQADNSLPQEETTWQR